MVLIPNWGGNPIIAAFPTAPSEILERESYHRWLPCLGSMVLIHPVGFRAKGAPLVLGTNKPRKALVSVLHRNASCVCCRYRSEHTPTVRRSRKSFRAGSYSRSVLSSSLIVSIASASVIIREPAPFRCTIPLQLLSSPSTPNHSSASGRFLC